MLKKTLLMAICFLLISQVQDVIYAEEENKEDFSFGYDIQLLPWIEADKIVPRYSKFTILDIESKKIFHVQRRAGSQHADVQPLTKEDTKILKEIYHGKWSWKRRAIIVLANDQWLAASMHGMPHGAGALNNNFPGHFCVHFLGSTTHKSDKMDKSHMLMVYKAAGMLPDYLNHLDAKEVVVSFIAGLKEQDSFILKQMATEKLKWKKELASLENIRLMGLKEIDSYDNDTIKEYSVEWQIYLKNRKPFKETKKIMLIRSSELESWKVVVYPNYLSKSK
ncbi:hypothetical protein [Niallia nealsonii]|uniref:Uncharacterized protein n=1 Tax=Niallia nealsonii TaxID=115979 RepID=A0A2N0Z3C9_9BACI|nr:hypothetical protein [Niallia nealsonii]PKG24015.1 hypothetical protein CWS01_08040 [Niallia nealsonii]